MVEIVNLNKIRKARKKVESRAKADANRLKFSRTKVEKAEDASEDAKRADTLDGARRDDAEKD